MPAEHCPEDAQRETSDSPTVWFAVLERALRTGNYDLAARAKRHLERLGVTVKFQPGNCLAVPA